jgi:phosphoribosylamine--glycine ligase
MKDFAARHRLRTARHRVVTDAAALERALAEFPEPPVVKADGLCAGKGVIVAESHDEALLGARAMLSGESFGDAGVTVVLEERIAGAEVSAHAICDGERVLMLPPAQDHKRIGDGDSGPNTGGMGAYSPAPVVTPAMHARIMREVILPTVPGMAADGIPFTGFLYAGVMIDAAGTQRVLEFNCRMGHPETQPIIMRLKSDLVDLVVHAVNGTLDAAEPEWDRRAALGVVVAAAGYPENPRRGDAITGLPADAPDVKVFHAATARQDDRVVVTGGRVLCVTALGDSVKQAQRAAYAAIAGVHFDGMQYRRDIGHRALAARKA